MRGWMAVVVSALLAPGAAGAAPEAVDRLFAEVPLPPDDLCNASPAAKEAFRRSSGEFRQKLDQELGQRRRDQRKVRKADEQRVKQEMAERYPEAAKMDRKKMKGMSKEEKMAMAMQMMSQGGAPTPPAAQSGAAAAAAQEQQALAGRVSTREQEGRARLDAYLAAELHATEEARAKELGPLEAEYRRIASQTIASSEEERRSWTEAQRQAWAAREAREAEVVRQYRLAAGRYCARLAPGWREALVAYRAAILASRADYDRLEAGQPDVARGAGVELTPLEPGVAALEALHRYAAELGRDPFRFDVRPPQR